MLCLHGNNSMARLWWGELEEGQRRARLDSSLCQAIPPQLLSPILRISIIQGA